MKIFVNYDTYRFLHRRKIPSFQHTYFNTKILSILNWYKIFNTQLKSINEDNAIVIKI